MKFSNNVIIDVNLLKSLNDKEFYSNFCYFMQAALVKDASSYMELIDNMYEICERKEDALVDMTENYLKTKKLLIDIDNLKVLNFGTAFANILSKYCKDFSEGELLSLGMVAESFISYKRNWLTKDEYYEIRDMFVPFYLPISVELLDIADVIKSFETSVPQNDDGTFSMILLKKIGKTVQDNSVNISDIEAALNEINFDEAW